MCGSGVGVCNCDYYCERVNKHVHSRRPPRKIFNTYNYTNNKLLLSKLKIGSCTLYSNLI